MRLEPVAELAVVLCPAPELNLKARPAVDAVVAIAYEGVPLLHTQRVHVASLHI